MDQRIRRLIVMVVSCFGLLAVVTAPVNAQSDTCADLKKDIIEMKADLDEYKKARGLDPDTRSGLMREVAEIRKDLQEYLSDPKSDRNEKSKASDGLRLLSELEDGVTKGEIARVVSSYAKIIEVYEWFYENEDCD